MAICDTKDWPRPPTRGHGMSRSHWGWGAGGGRSSWGFLEQLSPQLWLGAGREELRVTGPP